MNKAAVMLCQGNLLAAKSQLDELLEDQNLRVIQTESSNGSDKMIPDYLIKLLVYFMLTTSKSMITFIFQSSQQIIDELLTIFTSLRKLQDGSSLDKVPTLCARHKPYRPNECLVGSRRPGWKQQRLWPVDGRPLG